jgi:hypothetical protein
MGLGLSIFGALATRRKGIFLLQYTCIDVRSMIGRAERIGVLELTM